VCESQPAIILVVEDHKDTRDLYVALLEAEGFRAIAAANGEEALRHAETVRFDAIILDLGLRGGLDGHGVAERLRACPRGSVRTQRRLAPVSGMDVGDGMCDP
jgi:CheY-like chemotaxis protein